MTNLAYAFKRKGDYNSSVRYYQEALKLPKTFSIIFQFRHVFAFLQEFKEGWEKYEYRWKVDPGDKVVWPLNNSYVGR